MNEKERLILKLIQDDPFITQNELAEKLNLSRPAVANYISSLMKRGEIIGRAYVLREQESVVCIGGANVDRKIMLKGPLQFNTSNPVTSYKAVGGVARNIAENLGRLGVKTTLLTALGDDVDGKWLVENSKQWMDLSFSITYPSANTGNYMAVLDENGEMQIGFADMDICDLVEFSQIEDRWNVIKSANYVLTDLNFPAETIAGIIRKCYQDEIPLIITPVSIPKIHKLPDNLAGVYLLIANKGELMEAAGLRETAAVEEAVERLFARGVDNLVVTEGSKGLHYFTKDGESGHLAANKVKVVDVTGAGDSLAAGVIYGLLKKLTLKEACHYGQICSAITIQSEHTVSPHMNRKHVEELYRTLKR